MTPHDARDERTTMEDGDEPSAAPAHDPSRRAILIRALVAAPLLVTLAARPALARAQGGSLGMYEYGRDGDELPPDPGDEDSPSDGGNERGRRPRRARR
jgi:hypothetical protein